MFHGKICNRQRPIVSNFATNTDVSLYYNQSAILAELKTLQNRISEIDARLIITENETDRALQLLEEHKACMQWVDTYKKLATDIKREKYLTIKRLERENSVLKEQQGVKYEFEQESGTKADLVVALASTSV